MAFILSPKSVLDLLRDSFDLSRKHIIERLAGVLFHRCGSHRITRHYGGVFVSDNPFFSFRRFAVYWP
ncbi:MAG: hypothetical protein A3H73_01260 [Candidatus Taylorbacteria bacterium RIFCSPLOWO2_02_FULL_50_120]|nr:MAG: hypothetical protein A2759_02895 [Candidatus Taylorbacteria bacterium RIFCSPHIGHO2_01_FULL_49_60]OHA36281.1 MAG: hypothetical protein A2W65_03040 [Candidatus Taylorbacteria bacterium RIFCSPLOWO2_02_50_13]OHA40538.1 MAG: hypothetical protein A3H73_01260 [Candidatus Taylorbacteria bacterium RIFCSPLOWO2_02_FULL_50_120]OHA46829.1 MAG: hypothetical protein A3G61_03705 [Candidatus Taylorbacteria bacterium RIFCSPLOWO2_12_FULL_49_67]